MATSKQSYLDPPPENNPNPTVEEEEDVNDHESEDSLSLCNLVIYSSTITTPTPTTNNDEAFNSKEILRQISSNSLAPFSEDNENFFEFFGEEWNISNSTTLSKSSPFPPDEIIIFCGKQIPSKQPLNIPPESHSVFSRSKRDSSGTKGADKRKVVVPKVFGFKSPVKSKWLHVLLGLTPKIPTAQMEVMSDIRNRQRRHGPSMLLPSNSGSDGGGDKAELAVRGRARENRLWRFIKAASCFGGQQNM